MNTKDLQSLSNEQLNELIELNFDCAEWSNINDEVTRNTSIFRLAKLDVIKTQQEKSVAPPEHNNFDSWEKARNDRIKAIEKSFTEIVEEIKPCETQNTCTSSELVAKAKSNSNKKAQKLTIKPFAMWTSKDCDFVKSL